jgi:hypothetical protein
MGIYPEITNLQMNEGRKISWNCYRSYHNHCDGSRIDPQTRKKVPCECWCKHTGNAASIVEERRILQE